MASRRQLLEANICSLRETVRFHEARGEQGDYARASALRLLERDMAELEKVKKGLDKVEKDT